MYRDKNPQMNFNEVMPPFNNTLDPENRWVKLAELIPWDEFEDEYAANFGETGNVACPLRMALGSVLIQEKKGLSNIELVQELIESRYLQYFIGLDELTNTAPFDQSALTRFRQRLSADIMNRINQRIIEIENERKKNDDDNSNPSPESKETTEEVNPVNKGKLLLDATCAPADITYPTDAGLLNKTREKTEKIIDVLHEPLRGIMQKPRTYREKARRDFLSYSKNRKGRKITWKKACKKQLGYVKRNLGIIKKLMDMDGTGKLSEKQQDELKVISKLYRQQAYMHENNTHRVGDRIVSIDQHWVRPIKRGKVTAETEFGAKVSISVVDGYTKLERISWDNFNESSDLVRAVEQYREERGFYPEAVQADKIYRNRTNLNYCRDRGIRLSGPPLGRPPKDYGKQKESRRLAYRDSCERNAVEGKFGEAKNIGSLGRLTARLKDTSEAQISMVFLVLNLNKVLRDLLRLFLEWYIEFQYRLCTVVEIA